MTPVLQLREQLFARCVGAVPHGGQILTQFNIRAQLVVVGEKRRQLLALRLVEARPFLLGPFARPPHPFILFSGSALFSLSQFPANTPLSPPPLTPPHS